LILKSKMEIKIMPRGGYRPGAGRPKRSKARAETDKPRPTQPTSTPLDYLLAVMNDPTAEPERRDRMAIAAAPFVHPRAADGRPTKKQTAEEVAARAGKRGRFATPPAPAAFRLVKIEK
jgi:hypothetical protein